MLSSACYELANRLTFTTAALLCVPLVFCSVLDGADLSRVDSPTLYDCPVACVAAGSLRLMPALPSGILFSRNDDETYYTHQERDGVVVRPCKHCLSAGAKIALLVHCYVRSRVDLEHPLRRRGTLSIYSSQPIPYVR